MTGRPTIEDLAAAAGVSTATVDRVLNRRQPVRPQTADRVLKAAEAIGFHAVGLIKQNTTIQTAERTFGFLLQKRSHEFYQALAADLTAAVKAAPELRGRAIVEFVDELSPASLVEGMRRLGEKADALAVVSIDHPLISAEISRLADRGVPTFALISDLTAERRVGYVGRDNRKEGRTAAWMIEHLAKVPGPVGIIVGSHRYLCQETAEMSFRAHFREFAPDFRLAEPLFNLDDPDIAYEATLDLLAGHPDLAGLYICGGGTEGVVAALRQEGRAGSFPVVCHELTSTTRGGLIDGAVSAVIATATDRVATRLVAELQRAMAVPDTAGPSQIFVPFILYVPENI